MIVSCAPFRVSFAGGGSDIASFYTKKRGAVLSCAIAKYSFIIVHPFFNSQKYHLKYTKTEIVDTIDEIQHPLLREALRMQGIGPGIEIASVADVPAGTGLGSSSSFAVALINALYAHGRVYATKETLAQEACILEIDKLHEPIGKQDQYAAAYGGVNLIEFERHGSVTIHPIPLSPSTISELENNLILFYTGDQRDARSILSHQVNAIETNPDTVSRIQQMTEIAYEMRDLLVTGDLDGFGLALHRGWEMKRDMLSPISNSAINDIYSRARAAGALGGKLAGAGGGGFLLLYCPKSSQTQVRQSLGKLQTLEFRIDWAGARIIIAQ